MGKDLKKAYRTVMDDRFPPPWKSPSSMGTAGRLLCTRR